MREKIDRLISRVESRALLLPSSARIIAAPVIRDVVDILKLLDDLDERLRVLETTAEKARGDV